MNLLKLMKGIGEEPSAGSRTGALFLPCLHEVKQSQATAQTRELTIIGMTRIVLEIFNTTRLSAYKTFLGSSVASNPMSIESDGCNASLNPRKKEAASD
jgi:hypothetical protein